MNTLIQAQEVVNDGIFRPAPNTAHFDPTLIGPHIASAEEGNTIRLLGLELFEDMVLQQNPVISNYNPNAGALVQKFPTNAVYEALWTKYLMRYEGLIVYAAALPFIGVQTTTQGLLINDTEYARNAGIEGVKFMQDTIQRHIDNLEPLITNYLCKNSTDFTLFDDKDCKKCEDDCKDMACQTCNKGRNSSTKIIFY